MSAERGWIIEPQPGAERRKHSVEVWAERHRLEGHHPHPAPTLENPERWDCDCGGVNRMSVAMRKSPLVAKLRSPLVAR
jgi:hypothetical protein